MAVEMANIFKSLNAMLESQEKRQRFDVEASLAGMELSMKREQQVIGQEQWASEQKESTRQFNEEVKMARRGLKLNEDEFELLKQEDFRKQIAQLAGVNKAETINKEKQLWGTYFAEVHDSYFTSIDDGAREYSNTERKKLNAALTKATGDKAISKQISGLLIKYGQNPNESAYMEELAMIYNQSTELVDDGKGGQKVRNPEFIKGMMSMGMMPSTPLGYQNVRQDFNDLMQFHEIGDKLVEELYQTTSGDYKFETDEYGNIAYDFGKTATAQLTSSEQKSFSNQSLLDTQRDSLLTGEEDTSDYHMFGKEVTILNKEIKALQSDVDKKEDNLLNLSSELKKANLMLERGMKLNDVQTSLLEDETVVRQRYQKEIAQLNQSIGAKTKEGKSLERIGKEEAIKKAEYTPPGIFHFGIDALEKLAIANKTGIMPTDEVFKEYTKSRKAKQSDSLFDIY